MIRAKAHEVSDSFELSAKSRERERSKTRTSSVRIEQRNREDDTRYSCRKHRELCSSTVCPSVPHTCVRLVQSFYHSTRRSPSHLELAYPSLRWGVKDRVRRDKELSSTHDQPQCSTVLDSNNADNADERDTAQPLTRPTPSVDDITPLFRPASLLLFPPVL